jgi:hypothetical protein
MDTVEDSQWTYVGLSAMFGELWRLPRKDDEEARQG